MHKFYRFVGRFFTVISAILFVITLAITLILYGPGRLVFHSDLYKNVLSDLDVYEKIPAIARNFLPASLQINPCSEDPDTCSLTPTDITSSSIILNLTPEDWQALLEILLPQTEIKTTTESALDGLFAFLHGDSDQISVSMGVFKDNLTGTAWEDKLHLFFTSQPPCNEAEEAELSTPYQPGATIPLCKPTDVLLNPLISNLRLLLEPHINKIPDEIAIRMTPTTLKEIRLGIDFVGWMPLIPLLFLIGVAFIRRRSLKSGLNLWGTLFFIGSLFALAVGLAFRFGAKAILDLVLGFTSTDILTPDLINIIRQLEEYLLDHLTDWIIYPALLILLLSLAAWISSALIRKNGRGTTQLPSEPPTEAL